MSITLWLTASLAALLPAEEASVKISEAKADRNGFLVHTVESLRQDRKTTIRVLLPKALEKGKSYRVVYVLPVEAGDGNHYGDGLAEVKKLGLHDTHKFICVMPTFARLPWYADHPTNAKIAQETYLMKEVLPFIEKTYPVLAKAEGRLLLGFSKSGWGAFTLLLRHPDVFGKAAAWDAPLMMDAPGKYGSGEIFASKENFAKYQVTKLLEGSADKLGKVKRLAVLGHGGFRKEHQDIHDRMQTWKIAHEYRDGPQRKHDWHSGWVKQAIEFLVEESPAWPGNRGAGCVKGGHRRPGAGSVSDGNRSRKRQRRKQEPEASATKRREKRRIAKCKLPDTRGLGDNPLLLSFTLHVAICTSTFSSVADACCSCVRR